MVFYSHLDSNSQGSFSKAHVVSPLTWYHKDLQCLLVQPFYFHNTTESSSSLCLITAHIRLLSIFQSV